MSKTIAAGAWPVSMGGKIGWCPAEWAAQVIAFLEGG